MIDIMKNLPPEEKANMEWMVRELYRAAALCGIYANAAAYAELPKDTHKNRAKSACAAAEAMMKARTE
jgi:hypothetical protein